MLLELFNLYKFFFYLENRKKFIIEQQLQILEMIWTANTAYAYIIPERWISVLNMDHLCPNGQPIFYVVKEKMGKINYPSPLSIPLL